MLEKPAERLMETMELVELPPLTGTPSRETTFAKSVPGDEIAEPEIPEKNEHSEVLSV